MITKWKELSREVVYQKYSRKIEKVVFKMPDNSESDFYIKKEGPTACILPLTKNNEVILVRQFRPGPMQSLLELPGGYVETGDNQNDTVQKELLEETGYAGEIEFVTKCYDDAYSTMERYCFVARHCKKISEQKLEKTEFAEVHIVSLEKFRKLLRSGDMTDVEVGYLCLDYLQLL